MDCPSEERLIRMKLEQHETIRQLDFDIPNRQLTVVYQGDIQEINSSLQSLQLGSELQSTEELSEAWQPDQERQEKRILWSALFINFFMFLVEMSSGLVSRSMGLVADSLDMLADAFVYALSLFAVGQLASRKKRIAALSGYFQMLLAVMGLLEVIRRFLGFESVPEFRTMIIISLLALTGNAVSLYLLQKSKSKEAHIQASLIFTSNDVLVNLGVILAGIAVYISNHKLPDLIVGTLVFVMVMRGAIRILKLAK